MPERPAVDGPGDTAEEDEWAMRVALDQAREAAALGEVPVGAVVVKGRRLIARAFNLKETLRDPTAHAECLALRMAGRALGTWRLEGCTLVVTLEPCPMCAGAIVQSRVGRVVYGVKDPKAGAVDSLYRLLGDRRLNHRCEVRSGALGAECGALLSNFFRGRRV